MFLYTNQSVFELSTNQSILVTIFSITDIMYYSRIKGGAFFQAGLLSPGLIRQMHCSWIPRRTTPLQRIANAVQENKTLFADTTRAPFSIPLILQEISDSSKRPIYYPHISSMPPSHTPLFVSQTRIWRFAVYFRRYMFWILEHFHTFLLLQPS